MDPQPPGESQALELSNKHVLSRVSADLSFIQEFGQISFF